jgi:protein CpxP
MKNHRIPLILALAGMVALTMPAAAQSTNTAPPHPKKHARAAKPAHEGMDSRLESLNLTPDQQQKVQAAAQKRDQALASLKADTSLTPEQRREKMQAANQQYRKDVRATLNPEQVKKLQEERSERKEGAPHHNAAQEKK